MTNHNIVYEVVSALADADDVTTRELDYSLAEYIEPDLLEQLVAEDGDCELTFRVAEHTVTVTAAGEICIDETQYRRGHRPRPDETERAGSSTRSERLQLQRFFDNFPCTVYHSRNEQGWPIEFISGNCRELTGFDPNAFVIGGINFGFDLIHPDDRKRVSETVQQSVRNETPFSLSYRIETAAGAEKRVMEIGVGLYEEPEPISFVGVIIDIDDLKHDLDLPRDIRA